MDFLNILKFSYSRIIGFAVCCKRWIRWVTIDKMRNRCVLLDCCTMSSDGLTCNGFQETSNYFHLLNSIYQDYLVAGRYAEALLQNVPNDIYTHHG